LLGLLGTLNQQIGVLDAAVQTAAEENAQAKLLMTQPGVGPNTALAYVLTIGDVNRFPRGKQVASYRRSQCASIPDFENSICIAVTRSRKAWPKWQRRAS